MNAAGKAYDYIRHYADGIGTIKPDSICTTNQCEVKVADEASAPFIKWIMDSNGRKMKCAKASHANIGPTGWKCIKLVCRKGDHGELAIPSFDWSKDCPEGALVATENGKAVEGMPPSNHDAYVSPKKELKNYSNSLDEVTLITACLKPENNRKLDEKNFL